MSKKRINKLIIRLRSDKKAVALIIVIFAMMILAVLGMTLTSLQSTDFQANLRNYDSERALNLAEGGAQWGLNQLSINTSWRTGNGDTDCNDAGDWIDAQTLGNGQFNICCRNPTVSETGNAVIEAWGYMPCSPGPPNNPACTYRSRRKVKIEVTMGSFDKVLQAKNLFDWSLTHFGININGIVQAAFYEKDSDGTYNELGVDYDPLPTPVLPNDTSGADSDRLVASLPFPTIDMPYYEAAAAASSRTWAPPMTSTIQTIQIVGGKSSITLDYAIFTMPTGQWNGQALRNVTRGTWQVGNWQTIQSTQPSGDTVLLSDIVDWSAGDRVTVVPKASSISIISDIPNDRRYEIIFDCQIFSGPPFTPWYNEALKNFTRGTWDIGDWGVVYDIANLPGNKQRVRVRMDDDLVLSLSPWSTVSNQWLGATKRYRDNVTSPNPGYVWYIESDVLFDLRDKQSWEPGSINGNVTFRRTGLVAEGEVGIKGENDLNMLERPFVYPNLATKNGNITSPDTPAGSNDIQRRNRRNFDDLVYSENGTVYFNFLDAKAAYGNNVTFDGLVKLSYDNDLTRLTGFTWGLSNLKWSEEQ